MENERAIEFIKAEMRHCQIHMKDKNKASEYYQEMNELCEAYEMAIKALENSSWIPLSKYHPPKNAYYLTSTIYHEVYCDYWNGMNFNRTEAVLAWMPLPEPYTKEEQS